LKQIFLPKMEWNGMFWFRTGFQKAE